MTNPEGLRTGMMNHARLESLIKADEALLPEAKHWADTGDEEHKRQYAILLERLEESKKMLEENDRILDGGEMK